MGPRFQHKGRGRSTIVFPGRGLPKKGQVNKTRVYAMIEDISKSKFFLRLFFLMERIPHENPSSSVIINRDLIRFLPISLLAPPTRADRQDSNHFWQFWGNTVQPVKPALKAIKAYHFITINVSVLFSHKQEDIICGSHIRFCNLIFCSYCHICHITIKTYLNED